MKQGQKIVSIKEKASPLKAKSTMLMAAALVAGYKFPSDAPMIDAVEDKDGVPERTTTWSIETSDKVAFRPAFRFEELPFEEFRRRFEDLEWCRQNADHPIAYMRALTEKLSALRERLREMKPAVLLRKGKKVALIPQDADEKKRQEILAEF